MQFKEFIEAYLADPAPRPFNFALDVVDRRARGGRVGGAFASPGGGRGRGAAAADGGGVAMLWRNDVGEERRLSYAFFADQSDRAANVLRQLGVGKGDRVLVMLPRRPEWWITVLALMKLGAVALPVSVHLTPEDFEYRCRLAKVKAVVTEESLTGFVEGVRARLDCRLFLAYDNQVPGWVDFEAACALTRDRLAEPAETLTSDPMIMYFTSGTAGYPKMVCHDYLYALSHLATSQLWHGEREGALQWTITDTGWAKLCWGAFLAQWMAGSCIFVYEYAGHFDGRDILKLIARYGITNFCAPPTVYRMLMQEDFGKYNLSSLRCATCAGEAMGERDVLRWQELTGSPLYEGYGQTEAPLLLANLPGGPVKAGSLGRPLPGLTVEIVDDEGNVLGPGEEGNIAVRTAGVWPAGLFKGYLEDQELNATVFRQGWYYTRDLGVRDQEGFFWFKGRSDNVFKSAGYRISPFEVEKVLLHHEAVADCLVTGVPDRLRGKVVKAFVQLKPGFEESFLLMKDIQSFARKRLAPYMYPRKVDFVQALPRTLNGKKRLYGDEDNERE